MKTILCLKGVKLTAVQFATIKDCFGGDCHFENADPVDGNELLDTMDGHGDAGEVIGVLPVTEASNRMEIDEAMQDLVEQARVEGGHWFIGVPTTPGKPPKLLVEAGNFSAVPGVTTTKH